jgi:hypothetical protein
MIKELIHLANALDSRGLQKQANALDSIIRKIAEEEDGRFMEDMARLGGALKEESEGGSVVNWFLNGADAPFGDEEAMSDYKFKNHMGKAEKDSGGNWTVTVWNPELEHPVERSYSKGEAKDLAEVGMTQDILEMEPLKMVPEGYEFSAPEVPAYETVTPEEKGEEPDLGVPPYISDLGL